MKKSVIYICLFPLFWRLTESIECYYCNSDMTGVQIPRLCQNFDSSDNFIVDCKHSTMCMKKIVTLRMQSGQITTSIVRTCASQLQKDEQAKINGKWQYVDRIHEVYEEKCSEDIREGLPTSTTICYCRGDRCNSGFRLKGHLPVLGLFTLVMLGNGIFS